MSGRPNYLHERGLADGPPAAAPRADWGVDLASGKIIDPNAAAPAVVTPGQPDDYAARVLAVELGRHLLHLGIETAMEATHRFHAFLTATEKPPAAESTDRTFTDQ